MQRAEKFVGLGFAIVDEKIRKRGIVLPSKGELVTFLDRQKNIVREAGGVAPNILSTLASYAPDSKVRLLACTGSDERGAFYRSRTHRSLGNLQINPELPTAVAASVLDDTGCAVQSCTYMGAAETVRGDQEEMEEPNSVFITTLATLRVPNVFFEADKMLTSVQQNSGDFFLNLAGLNPRIAPRDEMVSVLTALRKTPDIVTGNEHELAYLMGTDNPDQIMSNAFPNTRLLVVTFADQGSLMRFEDTVVRIPPYQVTPDKVVDVTGAGDTFAGIMLGNLYTQPYARWSQTHVEKACKTAAFGASLAVQTLRTRLTDGEMDQVRQFHLSR